MYCENCGKNQATTHIKRVINGVATQKHLCRECAAKLGLVPKDANSLADILSSMFGDCADTGLLDKKVCGCCKSSFNDIIKSGKVGCPECYKTFKAELLPYIKRIHGNVKHIGKFPNTSLLAVSDNQTRLAALKEQLQLLVKEEEFEKAAQVRDEIRSIEKED